MLRVAFGREALSAGGPLGSRRQPANERLVGDGLVPLDSALGRHGKGPRTLHFPKDRQWIVGYGKGHLEC